jgi:hypothetical protein
MMAAASSKEAVRSRMSRKSGGESGKLVRFRWVSVEVTSASSSGSG